MYRCLWGYFSILSGIYLGMQLLSYRISVFSILRICQAVSRLIVSFANLCMRALAFWGSYAVSFQTGDFIRYEMAFDCSFDWYFPGQWCEHLKCLLTNCTSLEKAYLSHLSAIKIFRLFGILIPYWWLWKLFSHLFFFFFLFSWWHLLTFILKWEWSSIFLFFCYCVCTRMCAWSWFTSIFLLWVLKPPTFWVWPLHSQGD